MGTSKNGRMDDAPKPKAVRRGSEAAPVADTAKAANNPNGAAKAGNPRTPPPNARVVQPSYKTGTVSRAAVRAAIKRVSGRS